MGLSMENDVNRGFYDHMVTAFREEDSRKILDGKEPVLGGETAASLAEAVGDVEELIKEGSVDNTIASKLINSLKKAQEVRTIASFIDGPSI
jgi:hypothetical protein